MSGTSKAILIFEGKGNVVDAAFAKFNLNPDNCI